MIMSVLEKPNKEALKEDLIEIINEYTQDIILLNEMI
jgi:hypothetical protein